jgi:predicted metal-binding protein
MNNNKKCKTCFKYGKTAVCEAYDKHPHIKVRASTDRMAKGYCEWWVVKRRIPR